MTLVNHFGRIHGKDGSSRGGRLEGLSTGDYQLSKRVVSIAKVSCIVSSGQRMCRYFFANKHLQQNCSDVIFEKCVEERSLY